MNHRTIGTMFEKRVIPFGEKMTERHCRLAGYIGQIAVMTQLGNIYDRQEVTPTTNRHTEWVRQLCKEFHNGKYLDVEAKLIGDHDNILSDACHKIRFIRLDDRGRSVLDGDAQAALQYFTGQADFRLPHDYHAPFRQLIDYVADQTARNIRATDIVNNDDTDYETQHILRANTEIAYEVKYLEPQTGR